VSAAPCFVSISRVSSNKESDFAQIDVIADDRRRHVRVKMSLAALGEVVTGMKTEAEAVWSEDLP